MLFICKASHAAHAHTPNASHRLLVLGGKNPADAEGIQQAVVLTTSVKTLPVAVTVLSKLGPVLGDAVGVAVVPCVLAHLGQTLMDSILVSIWLARKRREAKAQ